MLAGEVLDDAVLVVVGDRIDEVRAPRAGDPHPAGTLLPGLVDIHCHGGGGHGFASTDVAEVEAAAAFHRARGTTTVIASLATDHVDAMRSQAAALAGMVGAVAGIHLEGPFLSPLRRGAHPAHLLRDPDLDIARTLLAAGAGHVRHVTLAPELPGAADVAELVRAAGAVVSLGHSDADAAIGTQAFRAGARSATHVFNGMRPWHHRDASIATAALAAAGRREVCVELVADGVHVDVGTVAAVFDLVPGQVALVSDAAVTAGLPDGDHAVGAVSQRVSGGVVRSHDGALAGGGGTLLDVVRFTHLVSGVPLHVAVAAASGVPAALMGLDRTLRIGGLEPGRRADVLVVDDSLLPLQVLVAGRPVAGDGRRTG